MSYTDELKKLLSSFKTHYIAGDETPLRQPSLNQIEALQGLQESEIRARYLEKGIGLQTVQQCHDRTVLKISGDMLRNTAAGWGTMLDPEQYTQPIMPVMCGAGDASAIYAGGGLPASIIDKKATAMVVDGATFKAANMKLDGKQEEFWSMDKIQQLEAAAFETGFNDVAGDAIRDAYLFGGSILYPVFKGDRPSSMLSDINRKHLEPKCISRWVEVDRWNTVYIPSFFPTAADYLSPKTIMVCQEAVEINTSRVCLLRPKPMPYWSVMANMGWSPSDITGWLQAYYAYETTQMSLPVMAQQMSLLLYRMPIDALNATVGVNEVEKLMAVNEQQMKNWSALSPKAVNMVGEVEVVDRTFSGFEQFVAALKSDLAAQTEIPEPSLWHTPNKGFSDNTQESLLKQSETLQMRQHYIERYMHKAKDCLIAHVWGTESEEWERRDELRLKFDKPMITTEKDLSDVGAKFAAATNSFVQAGMSPDTAMRVLLPMYPSVKLTDEDLKQVKSSYEERQKELQMAQTSVGGQGMNGAKASNNRAGAGKPQSANRKPNNAGGK